MRNYILILMGLLNFTSLFSMTTYKGVPIKQLFDGNYERELVRAVIDEDIKKIDGLITSGLVDINIIGKDGTSPLFLAISMQKRESFRILLQYGGDLYTLKGNNTLLYYCSVIAERFGDFYFLEEALKHGADPDSRVENFTNMALSAPLIDTKPDLYLKKIKLLMHYHADFLIPWRAGQTGYKSKSNVIEYMAWRGYFDSVLYILKMNENDEFFLAEVMKKDEKSLVKVIENIANETDINMAYWNIKDHTYKDLLLTISFLEEHGANIELPKDLAAVFQTVP